VIKIMILVGILLIMLFTIGCGSKPSFEQTDIFTSGTDGYHTYRIPALVVTSRGTILAFCEGRKNQRGDSGEIDLLLKRSTDGGQTWSEQQVVWDDRINVCGNPCPVVDMATGKIWLLITWNLGEDHEREIIRKESKDTRRIFVSSSQDDGISWAEPIEITKTTKDLNWGWYATGPGHGIQIKDGPHKGRLVVPCDHSYDEPEGSIADGPFEYGSHIIYSDDHGSTWKRGGVINPKVNECEVVELADKKGTMLINMRSYFGRHLRTQAISRDGGMSWSDPEDVADLIEPVCQASIIRFTEQGLHDKNRLFFCNPASENREKLTIKMSYDEGKTWPVERLLNAGPSAYSDLAVSQDMDVYCLYECGKDNPYQTISFAKFNLEWLMDK
jgi:sialidase-1